MLQSITVVKASQVMQRGQDRKMKMMVIGLEVC